MKSSKDKIIMFPKWKEGLEKESLQAMQEKRFSDALESLELLLSHDMNSHEILTGKVICLMELGRHDEAEGLCEELIDLHNEHYYEYIHIYLTLLFQMSKYEELMSRLDTIFAEGGVSDPAIKEQFSQLYEISKKLNEDKEEEEVAVHVNELETAITNGNPVSQWRAVTKAKNLPAVPHLVLLKEILIKEEIHPAVKTAIIHWLQDQKVEEEIVVRKFGREVAVTPSKLTEIEGHHISNQLFIRLKELEQKNPSLYDLIEKLLYRYLYVRYPIMPDNNQLESVSKALKWLGEAYLSVEEKEVDPKLIDEETKKIIEEIQFCEKEYLTVLFE